MKTILLLTPVVSVLLGVIPTIVYAQNGLNGIPPTAPNDCTPIDIGNGSCYNAGYLAGVVTYPHPFYYGTNPHPLYPCNASSQMNNAQQSYYCYGFRTGQLQLVLIRNNSTQPQSFIGQDFGDLRNVTAGLVNLPTGILHNEQGVFIPWNKICTQGQGLLLQPCSSFVNSDGILTPVGDRAVGCIRNGLAAGIAATKVGLSFNLTKSLLGGLAGPLGCGGIVDMNKIQNSNEFQYLLHSVG